MTSRLDAALAARGLARSRTHAATLIGAGLVIAGGAAIIWRERQLGLDRSKSKASSTPQGTPS